MDKKPETLEEKLAPKPDCEKCKGTGFVEKEGKKKDCKCTKKKKDKKEKKDKDKDKEKKDK